MTAAAWMTAAALTLSAWCFAFCVRVSRYLRDWHRVYEDLQTAEWERQKQLTGEGRP